MNVFMAFYFCFLILSCYTLTAANQDDSDGCATGFPDQIVTRVRQSTTHSVTVLIPEMMFTCTGAVTGFTVAGSQENKAQDPIIQIWREDFSHSDQGVYYNTGAGIAINETVCENGLVVQEGEAASRAVFHCDLTRSFQVTVQAGDILGLEIPPRADDDFFVLYTSSTKGPENFMFNSRPLASPASLFNASSIIYQLPQLNLQIESGDGNTRCTRGFPDVLIRGVSAQTNSDFVETRIIPDMKFNCNATIFGFIVAGRMSHPPPHAKIQIWREISDHEYEIASETSINFNASQENEERVCVHTRGAISGAIWCVLDVAHRVRVQPGDILGLELPKHDNDTASEIVFLDIGPENYVHSGQLNSPVNLLDETMFAKVDQLPQIIFNFTSDQCLSGFLATLPQSGTGRAESQSVTTRLIPEMKFGCNGTIVGYKVVASPNQDGTLHPKIQIWRPNTTTQGLYYQLPTELPIVHTNPPSPPCVSSSYSDSVVQCTLSESAQVRVQCDDILGLELPPTDDDRREIFFASGGPNNLVFQRSLSSVSIIKESEADFTASDTPLITFLVAIDGNFHHCPTHVPESLSTTTVPESLSSTTVPESLSSTTVPESLSSTTVTMATTTQSETEEAKNVSTSPAKTGGNVVAGAVLGTVLPAATVVSTLVAVAVAKKKKVLSVLRRSTSSIRRTYKELNPGYSGNKRGEASPIETKSMQSEIDDNITPNPIYTPRQQDTGEYEVETVQETDANTDYWKPAATVNELYKQLSSKKYREIKRNQVELTSVLGSGQFGEVHKGVWQSPMDMGEMEVAVKQLHRGASGEEKAKFLQEAAINGQFRHPNVVQLMGVVTGGESTMIVLELLSNGDLKSFLIHHRQQYESMNSITIDKHLLLRFCQNIASGMSYLASKSFVHRNLAARNILVSKNRICKISDFGTSRDLMESKYYVSHGGKVPVKWTAPEVINSFKYSSASDVWSFGCVMYEIWSLGHDPFKGHVNSEVIRIVDEGYRLPPPPGLSKELYKIMIQCWQPLAIHRPTFPQLVVLLSRADFELFSWDEEDMVDCDPLAKVIGAPLETSKNLYKELQMSYQAQN